jgi:hypothetical protein
VLPDGEEHVSAAELRTAFGVTEEDIALNTQGLLGPSQQHRLRRMGMLNGLVTLLVCVGLAAIWLAVVEHPIQWWQWLLVAGLEAAVLVAAARWIRRLFVAARESVVVRHSGPIRAYARGGKHLVVAELTYNVPIPLNRLVQGASYDVYVVELPAMVVAMVPTAPGPRS